MTIAAVDINAFMARFHTLERDLSLFDDTIEGALWWDSVRFEVCYFLYDCLTGLTYSEASRPGSRSRALGRVRRKMRREALLADSALRHRDLLVIRAARSLRSNGRSDVVLDPMVSLFSSQARIIDTVPGRFHLPEYHYDPADLPAMRITDAIQAMCAAFAIDRQDSVRLIQHVASLRARFSSDVAGYHRLFDRARPKGVLMVQNGIEKALFHVASIRGVPVAEAQHGLIGFGHPNYSYSRDIDYSRQTTFPTLFLTFSEFWSRAGYFPARHHAVIGTDHFAANIDTVEQLLGRVMVISADIYHERLLAMVRELARRLPEREFVYKLHPNQRLAESSIRATLSDLPNVIVGPADTAAAELLADVTHIVAIQSTVVYEALQSGRRIIILPLYDYQLHADLFDEPAVSVPVGSSETVAALQMPVQNGARPIFFQPFDNERAKAVLTPLIGGSE